MYEQYIKDYMKDNHNKEVEIIQRLTGGMSNHMFLIIVDDKKYTFRIPGKGAEHFTDRKSEVEMMEQVADLDFLPTPVVNEIETGIKIAPYVEGETMNQLSQKPVELVAATLKKLHNHDKFKYDYNPLERLAKYESITSSIDPVYAALKEKWVEIYDEFLSKVDLVPCHADAQVSNFIVGEDRIYLLDWEFAGNNDPIYDIACFGNNDFDDAIELLEVYYEAPGKNEFRRLYAWRMYQALQWHNVAKYKGEIGLSDELSVDFSSVANNYLELAKGCFQDYLDVGK
ncbi:MAG: choline/ethanolamine kinase family protein [Erysipelotrichales bacterium]